MAMDGDSWGTAVAAAVKAIGVEAGTPVSDAQLQDFWKAVKGEDQDHLTNNMETDSNGATQSGPPGGPLPISALPGTVS